MQSEASIRKGVRFRVSEVYQSVQGEGLLTGTPSVFVRTSGCNLRCWFCDTRFASWEPEGEYLRIDTILQRMQAMSASHVVLTGGEPMIYAAIGQLCAAIKSRGYHLTIETAGTVYRQVDCDLMSLSPKLRNSAPTEDAGSWVATHHRRREQLDVVRRLMKHPYQLKFVVDRPEDAGEVQQYLSRLGKVDHRRVLLMPQGVDEPTLERQAAWLVPWCKQHGLQYCPRQHIHWFGNRRGT